MFFFSCVNTFVSLSEKNEDKSFLFADYLVAMRSEFS